MSLKLGFHPLVQRDLYEILAADSSGQRNRWWRGENVIWSGIVEAFPWT
jgi:hypothetical protein